MKTVDRFEREMRLYGLREYQASPAPAAYIAIKKVHTTWSAGPSDPEYTSGKYRAFFKSPLPGDGSPTVRFECQLFLQDPTTGVIKPLDATGHKKWKPKDAVAKVLAAGGTSIGTASLVKVAQDGTFTTETLLVSDKSTRLLSFEVSLELAGGHSAMVKAVLERIDLEGFLARVDALEAKRPSTMTHLEFVAAVRKLYLFVPAFDKVLYRSKGVAPIHAVGTPEEKEMKRFKTLYFDGEYIDISHVLVGIEGMPAQDPSQGQSGMIPSDPELMVTWVGDLGAALEQYIRAYLPAYKKGDPVDIEHFLSVEAPRADLIGNVDGINVGAAYDATKTLKENLDAYYGSVSKRRFRTFMTNSKTGSHSGALLSLKPKVKPPKITDVARTKMAERVKYFTHATLYVTGYLKNLTTEEFKLAEEVFDTGSNEMAMVVDHFVYFVENGLAREK